MSASDVRQWLETAHLPGAVARILKLSQFDRDQITLEVARWERLREGHHARPDQMPIFHGNPQGQPFPGLFGPREKHYDELNDEQIAHGDKAYDNVAKETMETTLQMRIGTDANLPIDPPTLHDHIEAAWTAHAPEEK